MIQKLRQYSVTRATKAVNSIGENATTATTTFTVQMAISVNSGATNVVNLVAAADSTHVGVNMEGTLQIGDRVIDGSYYYLVDYCYTYHSKQVCLLTRYDGV